MMRFAWEQRLIKAGVPETVAHEAAHAPSYIAAIKVIHDWRHDLRVSHDLIKNLTGGPAGWSRERGDA